MFGLGKSKKEREQEEARRFIAREEEKLGYKIKAETLKYFYKLDHNGEGEAFVNLLVAGDGSYGVGIESEVSRRGRQFGTDREAAEAYFQELWDEENAKGNASEITIVKGID